MTNKQLIELVEEVNRECFNNKVDLCFPIRFFYSNKMGGKFYYKWKGPKKQPRVTFFIEPHALSISSYFNYTKQQLKNIIAHELIHALELQTKLFKAKNCHGRFFKKHMKRINKKFGYNITIRTKLKVLDGRKVEYVE